MINCPHAARMSRPRDLRTETVTPRSDTICANRLTRASEGRSNGIPAASFSGSRFTFALIPFNAWPGAPYECSDWERIEAFGDIVNRAGYASPIRTPRGRDILAACGQLKTESQRLRRRLSDAA